METSNLFSTFGNLTFLVISLFFLGVSLLSVFIFVRYGQTKSFTVSSSFAFLLILFILLISALIRLNQFV